MYNWIDKTIAASSPVFFFFFAIPFVLQKLRTELSPVKVQFFYAINIVH